MSVRREDAAGEMNRAFGSVLTSEEDSSSSAVSHWAPAVDVHEHADRFRIVADVPGVSPDGIEITMENGVLTLAGERKSSEPGDGAGSARRLERVHGTFHRRFTLPDSADADAIEAGIDNGVLEISIPKKAKVQPRKIKVGG